MITAESPGSASGTGLGVGSTDLSSISSCKKYSEHNEMQVKC